jgi:PelA/Pel-15E family pectate lyase
MSLFYQRAAWFVYSAVAVIVGVNPAASAAIIGTNPPARPLTVERIAALPESLQPAWKEYLTRSDRQRRSDQDFLKNEIREHGLKQLTVPPEGGWRALDRTNFWYSGAEARHIAGVILSFQTPAGGWSKNLDMAGDPRVPGMAFAPDNSSPRLSSRDFDAPLDANWNYVGTFDNDATIMQLRFLAKIIPAVGTEQATSYRAAFVRGLDYVLAAQYPNGGWPQVWPLSGGYHDAITYNDNAMCNILFWLRAVSEGTGEFAFVPVQSRVRAAASLKHGIECVLATQIIEHGHRTVWCQQYDVLTLQPTSARNYEMPSKAAGESAGIMRFLMQLPNPGPEVVAAVQGAATWFKRTEIRDAAFKDYRGDGRHLIPARGNGPLWARFYELGSDRPVFGDRDKSIHDNVDEISKERRNGYAWYGNAGARALEQYAHWSLEHPSFNGAWNILHSTCRGSEPAEDASTSL